MIGSSKSVIHVLLCEDDLVNLQINKRYIELFGKELCKNVEIHDFQTVEQAMYEYIDKIDIAVLDIDLDGHNGMDFAKRLQDGKRTIPIIFITNYEKYRVDASLILAVGLLRKPVDPDKFRLLFNRAVAQVEMEEQKELQRFLSFAINKKEYRIKMSSIISLEKIQKKIQFKTDSGIYEVRETLAHMEEELTSDFLRISQSVIVNMNEIICIEGREVFLSTRDSFIIGRTYQKKVETTYRLYWK